MAKKNTKEIILFKALSLFADKGYDGVTVRDIAAEVGIMQSSLYKHYKNKQEIFDTLVEEMQLKFKEAALMFHLPEGELKKVAEEYAIGGNEILKKISKNIFHYYLKDPYASKFRRLLSIERYKNKDIDNIYRNMYLDSAISYQATIFREMIKQGFIRDCNPEIMALQFFSPIFVLLNQYDCIPEKEKEVIESLENHIEQFDMVYRKE
ncbi:TetR/AcrR family transcriptional regulator [Blautia coccoides]|uniref:TetR/AcrR family transcriptional regulator n=2 Tax=Blautia producta TaxID=33035 RepID=A0A7G5MVT0_9FIRM|nr:MULTISPECIES: TetR/AcrR family transcriptional regulator [Blautia]MDU5207996.1 TetR/AcrR family transcriptional regulator [Clostridioides difficile]MDU6869805.1 TetR/AcrR family transcriptional regulator [Enterococcus faecium]MCR1990106.1 TetR/AcrR family transcriptional regulator [Blautia coccoides]QIB54206.1 TetR/AcrR family transcriptional regulator [Blautia producta ATCC 27340 = DSM 2950]QMW78723.1 TetR/AcrR family transcriptional regulator [Blautia producta]